MRVTSTLVALQMAAGSSAVTLLEVRLLAPGGSAPRVVTAGGTSLEKPSEVKAGDQGKELPGNGVLRRTL